MFEPLEHLHKGLCGLANIKRAQPPIKKKWKEKKKPTNIKPLQELSQINASM